MLSRRAFFASMIPSTLVLSRGELTIERRCPICGKAVLWGQSRSADVTGPTDKYRSQIGLGNIYWHKDGSPRCHRDFYRLVRV